MRFVKNNTSLVNSVLEKKHPRTIYTTYDN